MFKFFSFSKNLLNSFIKILMMILWSFWITSYFADWWLNLMRFLCLEPICLNLRWVEPHLAIVIKRKGKPLSLFLFYFFSLIWSTITISCILRYGLYWGSKLILNWLTIYHIIYNHIVIARICYCWWCYWAWIYVWWLLRIFQKTVCSLFSTCWWNILFLSTYYAWSGS